MKACRRKGSRFKPPKESRFFLEAFLLPFHSYSEVLL
jgi:hypothetical protein